MSKHAEKYPGLYEGAKAVGMQYVTALARVRKGMSVADALAMPVRRYGRIRPIPLTLRETMYTARFMDKIHRQVAEALSPRVIRKRYIMQANDTSPAHIRRLRAAYCDHFIKFGTLDEGMSKQLKDYAHECRTAQKHSRRVPDEYAAHRDGPATGAISDNGRRVVKQIDDATARSVADFLRA